MKILRFLILIAIPLFLIQPLLAEKNFTWIRLYSGPVKIFPDKSTVGITPQIGMALKDKDIIKTDKNSWIILAFENASLIKIAPNSEVVISKADYDLKTKKIDAVLNITGMGRILSAIKKLEKNSKFDINTPTAVIGVRGTDFLVDVPDKDTSIYAVFDGKVIVRDFVSEQGFGRNAEGNIDDMTMVMDFLHEISLGEGKYVTYKKDKGFTKSQSIADKYKEEKKAINELKEEAIKLEKDLKKETPEDRQKKSGQIRNKAVK